MHQVKKWTKIMASPILISITNATSIELGPCRTVTTLRKKCSTSFSEMYIFQKISPEGFVTQFSLT